MTPESVSQPKPLVKRHCLGEPKCRGTYRMNVACRNCGLEYIVEYSKGHEADSGVTCPRCELSRRAIVKDCVDA